MVGLLKTTGYLKQGAEKVRGRVGMGEKRNGQHNKQYNLFEKYYSCIWSMCRHSEYTLILRDRWINLG